MITKPKLIFLIIIFFITPHSFAFNPNPLSKSDQEIYIKIFDFQQNGEFDSADKLINFLEDDLLMGRVLAQSLT